MRHSYLDKNTSSLIDENSVVRDSDRGLVINKQTSWRLIPKKDIEEEEWYDEYFEEEEPVERKKGREHNPYLAYSEPLSFHYTDNVERRYGFEDLLICTKQAAPVSCVVSEPIDTENAAELKVTCSIDNEDSGAVEFYVIDNSDKVSILPNNSKKVSREKLFYNQDLRFLPDTSKEMILYEDNFETYKQYKELTEDDFNEHTYAMSYTAVGEVNTYEPTGDYVQLAVVLRQYDTDKTIRVNTIAVHQSGDLLEWNLKT